VALLPLSLGVPSFKITTGEFPGNIYIQTQAKKVLYKNWPEN